MISRCLSSSRSAATVRVPVVTPGDVLVVRPGETARGRDQRGTGPEGLFHRDCHGLQRLCQRELRAADGKEFSIY
ncbi:MAG: hypothetical protein NDI81_20425 [Desulfobacula sp.]|nr:hypothetical protein [Desulfobacula sp.]